MPFPHIDPAAVAQAWYQAFMGHTEPEPAERPDFGAFHYRCPNCDVHGHGETCWCCGDSDSLVVGYPARLVNAAPGPRFDAEEAA